MSFDDLPENRPEDRPDHRLEALLPDAMRTAVADIRPPAGLVDGGIARGRRMRRNRMIRVAAGSVAAVAVIASGTVLGTGLLAGTGSGEVSTGGSKPDASVSPTPRPAGPEADGGPRSIPGGPYPSVKERVRILKKALPAGEVSKATSTIDPFFTVVFDDGKGASGLEFEFLRVGADRLADEGRCVPIQVHPYSTCTISSLPKGVKVVVEQGYTRPQSDTGEKEWRATMTRPDGAMITLRAYNSAGAKSEAGITRKTPALSPEQLRVVVTDPGWEVILKRIPKVAAAPHETAPYVGWNGERIMSTLLSRLPRGLRATAKEPGDGYSSLLLDDGRGRSMLGVNVQDGMLEMIGPTDCAERLTQGDRSCTETALPDGGLLRLTTSGGSKDGKGIVVYVADLVYPNGRRIAIRTVNGISEAGPRTRATPVVTLEQLRTIITDPVWKS